MHTKIENELRMLQVEYTKNLPSKMHSLDEKWKALSHAFTHQGMEEFTRAVHGLCGSLGTYGYHELGDIARLLEIYLRERMNNNEITDEESGKITELLGNLTQTFLSSEVKPINQPVQKQVNILEQNKSVYLLGKNNKFFGQVNQHLHSMGYQTRSFDDASQFNEAVNKQLPGAIIVDVDYLDKNEIAILKKTHQQDIPVPLFCIASQGDLLTRLKAIRAGSSAFFLNSNDAFYLTKTLDQMCSSSFSEPLRILIVDDSSSLAEYYSLILQEAGMETHFITHPLRMLDELNDFHPDLLLLDIYMPECSGLELAAALRQESLYAGIPIIFLSTEDDRFKQLAALNLGGDDFLTKPILPQHLVAAVRSRAKRAGILSSYMTRDSLTGLLNHTNVLQHLEIELSRAERLNSTLCFMMIDIDHFKLVNDTYGHSIGDHVIRKISELLLTQLRKVDLVGRYGGEEFAVILPNTTLVVAAALCARIRELFAQCVFKADENTEFSVTFSAGIASYPDFQGAKNLIDAADRALYQAKHQGRNQEVILKS